ncbi:MAG: hypothetical protein QOH47_1596 [Sphingomonadales bacterium]|jgi:hypothetical protein|nr:hypothetical protein [Sphingomonadales bacterium]
MSDNTILILGALAVVVVAVLVFGKRLGTATFEFLGFKGKVEETQRQGPKVDEIKNEGARAEYRAEGQAAEVTNVESIGDDTKFIAKS